VADSVEAISSNRPYRPAHGMRQALKHIAAERGRGYDAAVVDACLRVLGEGGFVFPEM
jgi:HD-GYP domain-containing protein (c-di-GMP phosphodiesterase class II)